jgi:hypothetical protein
LLSPLQRGAGDDAGPEAPKLILLGFFLASAMRITHLHAVDCNCDCGAALHASVHQTTASNERPYPLSELQRPKRTDLSPCPRCKTLMIEVVTIAPVAHEPGLMAYECPECGYLMSVLTPPDDEPSSPL